jgi:hypothetical protein
MLCVLLGLIPAAPAAAQAPDNPPIVQVGVFRIQPDGSVRGGGFTTAQVEGEALTAAVASSECRFGAGRTWLDEALPEWATDGWTIRGRVIRLSADLATIQLDWRRVRASGSPVDQPQQSRELTLPLDQFVALDSASPVTDAQCGPMTFGARFAPRVRTPGTVGGRAGGGGGVFSGAASGAATGVAAGPATGVGGGGRVMGAVRVSSVPAYDAELWLVHSVPGKPEAVVPAVVQVTGGHATFTFASVSFAAPGGTMSVRVDGTVRILEGTAPGGMLLFEAARAATFVPSDRPSRDPGAPDHERLAASAPLPGPNDVLAYEMPPLEVLDGPAVSDTFSIRLRLRPAGGAE